MSDSPKIGALRILHWPQIQMKKPFIVDVGSVEEAVNVMDKLADYDRFQLENKVKPDYCNTSVLEAWDGAEWSDWYDAETGIDDPREYLDHMRSA